MFRRAKPHRHRETIYKKLIALLTKNTDWFTRTVTQKHQNFKWSETTKNTHENKTKASMDGRAILTRKHDMVLLNLINRNR